MVSPLAHRSLELLPPSDVELDAGELHLGYRRHRSELYIRDEIQILLFELGGEPVAQRQEDRGVAGGVLELPPAKLAGPVLAAGRLVHRLVQVPLRHRLERIGRFVLPAVQDLRGEHRVEDGGERDAVLGPQERVVELPVVERLDRPVPQHALERRKILDREDVYDEGLFGGGELEQARLPVPGVQGRGLDIRADDLGLFE
jgi:hypothetical protein